MKLRRLPRFLRRDFMRKLVALLFALLVWLAVSAQLSETMMLHNVPVELLYNPAEVVIESNLPTVGVTVRGSPRALELLKSNDIHLAATVPEVVPGIYFHDLVLSPRNVTHAPPGIRVVDIDRRQVQIRLDRIVSRRDIPINVRFEGQIRDGYRRTRRSVVPSTMDIRGPHRIVRDIAEVTTEPVYLDDTIVRDFEVEVPITPIPGVEMGRAVHVSVQVARTSGQRNYAALPMKVLAPPGAALRVKEALPQVSVTVQGPQTVLERLGASQIHAFLDLTKATDPGRHSTPVQVWVDGDKEISVGYVHPATVSLELVPVQPDSPPAENQPAPPAHAPEE